LLHRVCYVCWAVGAILIVLSRFKFVPTSLGWFGFYVACAAAALTYLRFGAGNTQQNESKLLTRDILNARNHLYDAVIQHFREGKPIFFDGLSFLTAPDNQLFLYSVGMKPPAEMDETQALQDAKAAIQTFSSLANASHDIGHIAGDRTMTVILLSDLGSKGFEVCRVTGGNVTWAVRRAGA
jgi:hypothetical protein